MSPGVLKRRSFVVSALATLGSAPAYGLGRLPYGGKLRLALPFVIHRIDPHDARDPASALLAGALFDSAFAVDGNGNAYPTLAAGLLEVTERGLGVRLRPGLRDASGSALNIRDLEFSIARARKGAASALLEPFGTPMRTKKDPELLVFPRGSERALALALSSPLLALVPRSFDAAKPRGTGAFAATLQSGGLTLSRNQHAARGAALLDGIEVESVSDLGEALRRFEAESSDVGWLGRGLHRVRAGSEMFRSPLLGWLLLRTGKRLGSWGAPGAAQRLLASIEPARLERFGVRLPPGTTGASYSGPEIELLARRDAPHLVELGEVLAQLLAATPGNIRLRAEDRQTFENRVSGGDYDLALDFVRALGPTREQHYVSLLQAANPLLLQSAPSPPARLDGIALGLHATQATRTAIVSEFAVVAGRTPSFRGLESWDLGAVYRV